MYKYIYIVTYIYVVMIRIHKIYSIYNSVETK